MRVQKSLTERMGMGGQFFGPLQIILACFLWAIDTLFRYPLLSQGYQAFEIVFFENIILGAILLIPAMHAFKKHRVLFTKKRPIFALLVLGGMGQAVGTLLFTQAFEYCGPSVAILLQKLQPVVAITLSYFILGERPRPQFFFWASLSFLGAFLISFPQLVDILSLSGNVSIFSLFSHGKQNSLASSNLAMYGQLFALLAAIGWGACTVYGKQLENSGVKPTEILAMRPVVGAGVMLLWWLLPSSSYIGVRTGEKLKVLSSSFFSLDNGTFFVSMGALVIISGLLGLYFYYRGLQKVSARYSTILEMFFPLCAILVNYFILGIKLEMAQLAGAALLLMGTLGCPYDSGAPQEDHAT